MVKKGPGGDELVEWNDWQLIVIASKLSVHEKAEMRALCCGSGAVFSRA